MNPAGMLAIAVELDVFATLFKPVINAIVRNDEDDALKWADLTRPHGINVYVHVIVTL